MVLQSGQGDHWKIVLLILESAHRKRLLLKFKEAANEQVAFLFSKKQVWSFACSIFRSKQLDPFKNFDYYIWSKIFQYISIKNWARCSQVETKSFF